jgi:hypothetical protein
MWGWWEQQFERLREAGRRSYRDIFSGVLSLPAALFVAVGGFDPAFETCRDDSELGLRLLHAGAEVGFSRDAGGIHHELRDRDRLLERKRAEGRADVRLARRHPELWPTLPLSRVAPGTRSASLAERLVARLAFHAPDAGDQLLGAGLRLLDVLERFRLRESWRLLHGGSVFYCYLRGASESLDGWRAFAALADAAREHAALRPARAIDVDLSAGIAPAIRLVDAERPDALRIVHRGRELGAVPALPGAEPVRGAHLRLVLGTTLAHALVWALDTHAFPAE